MMGGLTGAPLTIVCVSVLAPFVHRPVRAAGGAYCGDAEPADLAEAAAAGEACGLIARCEQCCV